MQFPQKKIFRDVSLERLSSPDRLDELMSITTPRGWLILIVILIGMAGMIGWSIVGEITTVSTASGTLNITSSNTDTTPNLIQAEFMIPIIDAQVLNEGLEVEVSLLSTINESVGFVRGNIASIQQTDTLDDTTGEPLVLIIVALPTANTPTGLKWTVGDGPDITLFNGTSVIGNFVIVRQAPIQRVFPGIG